MKFRNMMLKYYSPAGEGGEGGGGGAGEGGEGGQGDGGQGGEPPASKEPGPTEVGPVRPAIILTRKRRGNTVRTKKPLARLCALLCIGLRIPAPVL